MTRRRTLLAVFAVLLTVTGSLSSGAKAVTFPSIGLIKTVDETTVVRYDDWPPALDIGVYVRSVGGAFEILAQRPNYGKPIQYTQTVRGSDRTRRLPRDLFDGWSGFADFFEVSVQEEGGDVIDSFGSSFCPNSYDAQRVDDSGPDRNHYPDGCGGHFFARGMIFGIERGWAVRPADYEMTLDVSDGTYLVTMSIAERFREFLQIPARHASATVRVHVVTGNFESAAARDDGPQRAPASSTSTPSMPKPETSTLPDLRSTPAWGFGISQATPTATEEDPEPAPRDYLDFAANEWNAGPQPIVVEGFRRQGTDTMDAYQYFYRNGKPVGKDPVGTFEFHRDPEHFHWHIRQFTEYSLLDAEMNEVVPAGKQSWCLVPTDALDLTVKGAEFRPWDGLGTSCGGESAFWIREVLPVGWGDTYGQSQTQAFDITDVPNGDYFVRVRVNPNGNLHETTRSNNTSIRKVTLEGEPGNRTVFAEPYKGIDTEGGYWEEKPAPEVRVAASPATQRFNFACQLPSRMDRSG
jgi:hypothetical protein